MQIKELERRLAAVFQYHCEKDNGLIAGPERLLNNTMLAIVLWLKEDYKEMLEEIELHELEEVCKRL